MVRNSVKGPFPVGVNVTVKVQDDAAATLAPQLSVSAKSGPMTRPLIVSAAEPILRKMTFCDALVLPTFWEPNCKEKGAIATADAFVVGSIFVTKASVSPPSAV